MSTLIWAMLLLALFHFIYESILAPSLRLSLRHNLFGLRDELRRLKVQYGDAFDDTHFLYLQGSINTMIAMIPRYDLATLYYAQRAYKRDAEFRNHVDERADMLGNCTIP